MTEPFISSVTLWHKQIVFVFGVSLPPISVSEASQIKTL